MSIVTANLLFVENPHKEVVQEAIEHGERVTVILGHGTEETVGDLDAPTLSEFSPASAVVWVHACMAGVSLTPELAGVWGCRTVGFTKTIVHPDLDRIDEFIHAIETAALRATARDHFDREELYDAIVDVSQEFIDADRLLQVAVCLSASAHSVVCT